MKRLLISLALSLGYLTLTAQEQKTRFENISLIRTTAGMATELSWKKGSEDIAYFIVERSTDGMSFKQCGLVFLSEDSNFTEYKYRDRISSQSPGFTYRMGVVTAEKMVNYLSAVKITVPGKS